jgi:putative transposase
VHASIVDALLTYEQLGRLRPKLEVTMPDHVHFIAQINQAHALERSVRDLKRYLARKHPITWQQGFFDHRIRSPKLLRETADYVRLNPVRAGLVPSADEWPFRWPNPSSQGGLSQAYGSGGEG